MSRPRKPRTPMIMTTFLLDAETHRRIVQIAESGRRSVSFVLRELLQRGVATAPEPTPPFVEIEGERYY